MVQDAGGWVDYVIASDVPQDWALLEEFRNLAWSYGQLKPAKPSARSCSAGYSLPRQSRLYAAFRYAASMAIQYCPKAKAIMLCDFSAGGFRHPEMVKRRPVVVVNSRLPFRDGLVTVVPLSGTESDSRAKYHCRIELGEELPHPFPAKVWWAKCDMMASVAFARLDYFHTDRDHTGKRKYLTALQVSDAHLEQIRDALRHALGLH